MITFNVHLFRCSLPIFVRDETAPFHCSAYLKGLLPFRSIGARPGSVHVRWNWSMHLIDMFWEPHKRMMIICTTRLRAGATMNGHWVLSNDFRSKILCVLNIWSGFSREISNAFAVLIDRFRSPFDLENLYLNQFKRLKLICLLFFVYPRLGNGIHWIANHLVFVGDFRVISVSRKFAFLILGPVIGKP